MDDNIIASVKLNGFDSKTAMESALILINKNRIEALYSMVVVSAGINDLSDRLANGDVISHRDEDQCEEEEF